MTSSARNRNDSGIVRPTACAVPLLAAEFYEALKRALRAPVLSPEELSCITVRRAGSPYIRPRSINVPLPSLSSTI